MPIHLSPVSRRDFIASAVVATAGLLTFRTGVRAEERGVDPDYFVLIADTHIDENPNRLLRGVNPAVNLDAVVKRILGLRPRPAAVIINGDAANIRGLRGEYGLLAWILRPLSEAGIPVHITMGNHDDRGPFYSILSEMKPEEPILEDQHVAVIETPNVNLFLLDTLDQVNVTPGLLGEAQLAWIDEALGKRRDKPAILFGHHTPTGSGGGLLDAGKMFEIVHSHRHAKAYFYGHSHRWEIGTNADLHLVNQPATAHVFHKEQPQGIVHARFGREEMRLELDCLDRGHGWHGEKHVLGYR